MHFFGCVAFPTLSESDFWVWLNVYSTYPGFVYNGNPCTRVLDLTVQH